MNPDHPYDQIVRYRHREGHTVWVRCRGFAIRDRDGAPVRMLGVHTDVTSEVKAQRRAESAEARLRAVSSVAEEFPADAPDRMLVDRIRAIVIDD